MEIFTSPLVVSFATVLWQQRRLYEMSNSSDQSSRQPAWYPEPGTRGTYSLLSTCLITLGFCAWSAIHVNIPPYKHKGSQWRSRVFWLLCAIFFPEYVAFIAFRQNVAAEKLRQQVMDALGVVPSRREAWYRRIWRKELIKTTQEVCIILLDFVEMV